MLRLVVLLFFFSLPSLTFSQLRIQAFDNQPVRYFIKKNYSIWVRKCNTY